MENPSSESADRERENPKTEPHVSFRAYLICAFASFGGILFGYDSGYINGVLAMVTSPHFYTKRLAQHLAGLYQELNGQSCSCFGR